MLLHSVYLASLYLDLGDPWAVSEKDKTVEGDFLNNWFAQLIGGL